MRSVALLRGVNVGGVRVPMAELRALLEGAGYANVRTVLASGNVVLDTGEDLNAEAQRLEKLIGDRFGYKARILVVRLDEVLSAIDAYPFERTADRHAYVLFVESVEDAQRMSSAAHKVRDETIEQVAAAGRFVFWDVPKGRTLDTPVSKLNAAEKSFVTTRNVNTLEKIATAG